MKLDILVFGAHPDDVELGCGGTIIKEVQNGKRVGVIDLTRGELGTRGSVKIRDAESKKASQIMGISLRDNMDFSDGFFENTKKNKILLVEKIRNYQPDIVITRLGIRLLYWYQGRLDTEIHLFVPPRRFVQLVMLLRILRISRCSHQTDFAAQQQE